MPDVSGKFVSEATTILEAKGFKIGTPIQLNSPKQPAGNVVGTVPKANSVNRQAR